MTVTVTATVIGFGRVLSKGNVPAGPSSFGTNQTRRFSGSHHATQRQQQEMLVGRQVHDAHAHGSRGGPVMLGGMAWNVELVGGTDC